jgi:hypothetical protein
MCPLWLYLPIFHHTPPQNADTPLHALSSPMLDPRAQRVRANWVAAGAARGLCHH